MRAVFLNTGLVAFTVENNLTTLKYVVLRSVKCFTVVY